MTCEQRRGPQDPYERAQARATRDWYNARFGVSEEDRKPVPPQADISTGISGIGQPTIEEEPKKPEIVTEYDGNQLVVKFTPGVDFRNGGSIPF